MSSREKELYDMVQGTKTSRWATSSNVTPHQQKLLNLLRSVKMMRRVNTTDSSDISDGISRKICGIGLEDQVDTRNADHLPSGYQVTYDEFEYDIEDDMDSVKTRSKRRKNWDYHQENIHLIEEFKLSTYQFMIQIIMI